MSSNILYKRLSRKNKIVSFCGLYSKKQQKQALIDQQNKQLRLSQMNQKSKSYQPIDINPIDIQMISIGPDGKIVVVKGQTYREGDLIQGHRIKKIHRSGIAIETPSGIKTIHFSHTIKSHTQLDKRSRSQ